MILTRSLLAACALLLGFSTSAYPAAATKSIRQWVKCDGRTDDTDGIAHAFAAARHSAFTLIVDCAVRLNVGSDPNKIVFIDDGTAVEFTGEGKLTVDNVLQPAFVIANSKDIALTNWNLEYDAALPVEFNSGPGGAFNDRRITPWLAANRGITFNQSQGGVHSIWRGVNNASAVFFVTGDTSNLNVSGMRLFARSGAGGDRFIPMAFSFTPNYKSNQSVTAKLPSTSQYLMVPHNIRFTNIDVDGAYMVWQGNLRDAVFEHIRSHHYGDLQDSAGGNVGGRTKWFAPPHLFYLNYDIAGDPALFNQNIRISDVIDDGMRLGVARDKGGTDKGSGNALSLKIGCVDCSVDHYKTSRPDGFLDLLSSNGLTISNVEATYDSSFLNDVYPGWRFPNAPYRNVTFKNITLKDTAASTVRTPIGDTFHAANEGMVFDHVSVEVARWAGQGSLVPTIAGQSNDVSLDFSVTADQTRIVNLQKDGVWLTLQATPANLKAGGTSTLTWNSKQAGGCAASGAWSGALPNSGSRSMNWAGAGDFDVTLTCENGGTAYSRTLRVVVTP